MSVDQFFRYLTFDLVFLQSYGQANIYNIFIGLVGTKLTCLICHMAWLYRISQKLRW